MGDLLCVDFKTKSKAYTRNPLEQAALDVVLDVTVPRCHDDLTGGSVLEYESSLGYWPKEPA